MAKNITIAKLDMDTEALVKGLQKTTQQIEDLRDKQEKLAQKGKEGTLQFLANEAALKSLTAAQRLQTQALSAQITEDGKLVSVKKAVKEAVNEVNNSENDYVANNKRLLELKKQLNSNDDDYEKRLANINAKLLENNNWLEENGSAHAKLITTMDDYKQQVADSFNQINIFNGGLSGLVSRAQEAGGVGPLVKGAFEGIGSGIVGMTKAAWGFVSNPIGAILTAIVVAVQLGMAVFKNFTPIIEKVEQVMAGVGAVIETVKNAFTGLFTAGESVSDFFSNITVGAAEAATEAYNLKKAQQELKAAMELQEVTAQKNANALDELRRKSQDMTLTEKERENAVTQLEQKEQEAFDARVKQGNESYNLAVRALKNGANLTQEEEKRLQKEGFAYLQKLQKVKQFSDEEIEALKAAEKKKDEIANETIARQQKIDREYADSLNKQQQAREKAEQDEARKRVEKEQKRAQQVQDAIEGQKLELELLLANQGIKGKAMTDELQLAQAVADKKRQIALAEFNASKKTANDKLRQDIANANITKELAETQSRVAVENAQNELNAFKEKNRTLLKDGTFLSEELFNAEKARLANTLSEEIKFLEEKKANNLISEQDLTLQLNSLKQADTEAQQQLELQRKEAQKSADAIDLENKMATDTANYDYNLGVQIARLDEQKAKELEAAEATGANKDLIEKKYAKMRQDTEAAVLNNKLELASSTFGNLATIMGKESAAGKAMAIAQTTIDTYQSATAAYKAMSGIPIVGPALGGIAAGAAVVSGLANVKKIASTKAPKAEKGALFNIGGNRHSAGGTMFTGADGTQFEAEQGELIGVMNRNAARHFMAFNNAFPAGGASAPNYFAGGGIVSREIAQQSLNTDELALKIAQANRSLPPPVVAVQDIITEGNSYVKVRDAANF
ncbi:hypothetical protein AMR72_10770 [Flavobacterium psychrophilum]|nr:hypothetical protein AMR72_10770 [Flavobacterium psychrophilum]AOE52951.1 hypothetical protein ALW18_10760 [Flavobacterium psychrophilum]